MTNAPCTPFTLDAGWSAVRDMIERLTALFARAAAHDRRSARILLDWLRPAEHLARLLLCAMAKAVALAPLPARARSPRRRACARAGRAFHVFLRDAARAPRKTRTLRVVVRWRRPVRREPSLDEYFDIWTRAGGEAAPRPPSTPLPWARGSRASAPDIVGRLGALSRVVAAPLAAARRVARRLAAAAAPALQRILSPARLHTDAPCLEALILAHDRVHSLACGETGTGPVAADTS